LKFLLKVNLPRGLGRMFESAGREWRHVGDIGMARAADVNIVADTKDLSECVLTHDLDYEQAIAFSGDSAPSVVIFRLRRTHADLMFHRTSSTWAEIANTF
jgi:predicted nuclease of predicted toxin-antitoxin system